MAIVFDGVALANLAQAHHVAYQPLLVAHPHRVIRVVLLNGPQSALNGIHVFCSDGVVESAEGDAMRAQFL